jgi:MoxR-like ATPase
MRALAREVPVASHVKEYAARLVLATHPQDGSPVARKYVRYGASPRGAQSLVLAGKILALVKGRYNVAFGDIREAAAPALRHRLILNFEAEAEGIRPDALIEKILQEVPEVPGAK